MSSHANDAWCGPGHGPEFTLTPKHICEILAQGYRTRAE